MDNRSYNWRIEESHLALPGLTRKYTFVQIADAHISIPDGTGPEEVLEKQRESVTGWENQGIGVPSEMFTAAVDTIGQMKPDGLMVAGDCVDYSGHATVQFLKEQLNKVPTETDVLYTLGNHEGRNIVPEGADEPGHTDFYPVYQEMLGYNPSFWVKDYGEFLVVGVDNSTRRITQEQMEKMKEQCARNLPIILMVHIPLFTDSIEWALQDRWGEKGYVEFSVGTEEDTPLTKEFCRMVKAPESNVAAIVAGHTHFKRSHSGLFAPGRQQFVAAPFITGYMRRLVVEPDVEISKDNLWELDEAHVKLSGLKQSYTFLHISDVHLAEVDLQDSRERRVRAAHQRGAWAKIGEPKAMFVKAIDHACVIKPDGLMIAGDCVDFTNEPSLQILREQFARLPEEVDVLYAYGNHEAAGIENYTGEECLPPNGRYPVYEELTGYNPGFWVKDYGEFLVVSLDNHNRQITREQIRLFKEQSARNLPIILLVHVPFFTENIADTVRKRWGERGYMTFTMGTEDDTELTREFCRMIEKPESNVAAIVAGHIHAAHTGEFAPGRLQLVSGAAHDKYIRRIVVEPA